MNRVQTSMPLVSVILAAYNAEIFISRTLDSILSQTYRNIEVIVVDDGSQDKTFEIVESFAKEDYRIVLLKQPNAGVAAARNLAIEHSQGEYIAPIDADDIWYPQNIEKQLQCMLEAEPSVGLVYAWSIDIDENDLPTGKHRISTEEGEVCLKLVNKNFIGHASATLIRRACFENIGVYNTQFREQNAQGCEDFDLYLRIAEKHKFRVVPEFLIGYRQVVGSMSCNSQSMAKSRHLALVDFQRRNPEIPSTGYKSSWINYYKYLASRSKFSGDYWNAIIWSCKVIKSQPKTLSNYKRLLLSVFKLVVQLLSSLNWKWLNFQKQIKENIRFNKQQLLMNKNNEDDDIKNNVSTK